MTELDRSFNILVCANWTQAEEDALAAIARLMDDILV